jgi:hypothetical protein
MESHIRWSQTYSHPYVTVISGRLLWAYGRVVKANEVNGRQLPIIKSKEALLEDWSGSHATSERGFITNVMPSSSNIVARMDWWNVPQIAGGSVEAGSGKSCSRSRVKCL